MAKPLPTSSSFVASAVASCRGCWTTSSGTLAGETRIVSVPHGINHDELMSRLQELFDGGCGVAEIVAAR
ncbi:hypothetical protein AAC387_Pa09g0562 [Persea americana]